MMLIIKVEQLLLGNVTPHVSFQKETQSWYTGSLALAHDCHLGSQWLKVNNHNLILHFI